MQLTAKVKKIILKNNPLLLVVIGSSLILASIMVDVLLSLFSKNETVGADVGVGIVFVFAAPLIMSGVIWYGLTQRGIKRVLILFLVAALSLEWVLNWKKGEDENNATYCREKYQSKNQVHDVDKKLCLKYL